ncbi:MAG TPA: tetratricopeptide repeat protein [Methanothrix sp.]|jgi:tetratricopeptide (TPR) repeat protein|nr:tetratricopeptide repeat protein [Methanothrix sp.]
MNNKEKVLLHRGMDKVKQKKFEEALNLFERVLAMNPEIPEIWNNKAVALYGLGRSEEALESYDRCLALDPENLDALRNKGFLLRNQRKLEEALQVYDIVLQKGGDAYDMESTAAVLTALGRLEEALSCLYLARDALPLERLEDEIEMVKGLMEKKGLPIPQRGPPDMSPKEKNLQGKE